MIFLFMYQQLLYIKTNSTIYIITKSLEIIQTLQKRKYVISF